MATKDTIKALQLVLLNDNSSQDISPKDTRDSFNLILDNFLALIQDELLIEKLTNLYIADNAITTSKIADTAVSNNKLATSSVSTAKIQAAAVQTASVKDLNITLPKLSQPVQDLLLAVGGGTITNNPDDEDLESVASVLKFKDRTASGNQKGYKIIRQDFDFTNIPAGYDNSIWEIRYEHDLGGANVNLPENVTLLNKGGFLDNYGGIVFDNTTIISETKLFGTGSSTLGTITNIDLRPEWWGAKADGLNDDTQAIIKMTALANVTGGKTMLFSEGHYIFKGVWQPIISKNDYKIIGSGANLTKLEFVEYTSGFPSCINFNVAFAGLEFKGFHIKGQGKTVLNPDTQPQSGIVENASTAGYNVLFENVQISDFSGDGVNINLWFQQKWLSTFARRCGGYGIVIDGDQAPIFSTSGGSWFQDNDNFALWFKGGYPILESVNFGPGIKQIRFGNTSPVQFCRPTLNGINLEWIANNGIGIQFENGSECIDMKSVLIYSSDDNDPISTDTAFAGVVFKGLSKVNRITGVDFTRLATSVRRCAGFENLIYIENALAGSKLLIDRSRDELLDLNENIPAGIPYVSGAERNRAIGIFANEFFDDPVISKGLFSEGLIKKSPVSHVRSVDGDNIDFLTNPLSNSIYAINPDDGSVFFNLPAAALVQNVSLDIVKAITTTNTIVIVPAAGQKINGATGNYNMNSGAERVNLWTDGVEWYLISNV